MTENFDHIAKTGFNFKNKVVLVTGSSKGLGKEIAFSLLEKGCNVMFNGKKTNSMSELTKFKEKSDYCKADMVKPKDCKLILEKIIKKWGKIDYLVCNIGGGKTAQPLDEELKDWNKMFELNFLSAVSIIKHSTPLLEKSQGVIVCISSIAGIEDVGAPIPYSVSKSALNIFIKGMASHLAKRSIRINGIAPGNIIFKGSTWEEKIKKDRKKVSEFLKKNVALERLGKPEEITPMVSFLLSDMASFMIGSIITIDGGQTVSY